MTEQTLFPTDIPEDIKALQEFEEDKKQFLERNADRFYKAYRATGSGKLLRIYQSLIQERQKC